MLSVDSTLVKLLLARLHIRYNVEFRITKLSHVMDSTFVLTWGDLGSTNSIEILESSLGPARAVDFFTLVTEKIKEEYPELLL